MKVEQRSQELEGEETSVRYPIRNAGPARLRAGPVPGVRLAGQLPRLRQLLDEHGRVMLKSSTGSGKTVLAAACWSSIIQFTSIANLEMFALTAEHFGIPIVRHYSSRKEIPLNGETILCTAYFVVPLARRFPDYLVVLDEAETMMEEFFLNVIDTRELTNQVLLMSATPEAIRAHGAYVFEPESAPGYAVSDRVIRLDGLWDDVERQEKSLLCCHSEPFARRMTEEGEARGLKMCLLDSAARVGDFASDLLAARVIVSTNIVRASITIPGLTAVYDFHAVYIQTDFPHQGLNCLSLFEPTDAQVLQLRGRVGRVCPGSYIKVETSLPTNAPLRIPSVRFPALSRRLGDVSPDIWPLRISSGPLLVEAASTAILERHFGERTKRGVPLYVTAVKRFVAVGTRCVLLLLGLETTGVLTRVAAMSVSPDEGQKAAAERLRECARSGRSFPAQLGELVKLIRGLKIFDNQLHLIDKWSQGTDETLAFEALFDAPTIAEHFACFSWRLMVRLEGGIYRSELRNLQVTPREKVAHEYCVLVGACFTSGKVTYLVAVPIPRESYQTVLRVFRETVTVEVTEALASVELPTANLFAFEGSEDGSDPVPYDDSVWSKHTGRVGAKGRLLVGDVTSDAILEPGDLAGYLTYLEESQKRLAKNPKMSRQGCPQSHVVSFPVLNALNVACARDATGADGMAGTYGDDLLASGERADLDRMLALREACGLLTNHAGTGFGRATAGARGFSVFCGITHDLGTGRQTAAPKAKQLLSYVGAVRPQAMMQKAVRFAKDLGGVGEFLNLEMPRLSRWVSELAGAEGARWEIPRRVTASRRVTMRAIGSEVGPFDRVVPQRTAELVVAAVEAMVLPYAPSSRGEPDRVLETDEPGQPLLVTMRTYREVLAAVEARDPRGMPRHEGQGPDLAFDLVTRHAAALSAARGRDVSPRDAFPSLPEEFWRKTGGGA